MPHLNARGAITAVCLGISLGLSGAAVVRTVPLVTIKVPAGTLAQPAPQVASVQR